MSDATAARTPGANPDSDANRTINLSRNLPPQAYGVFDTRFKEAVAQVLSAQTPTQVVGRHRFLGTEQDRDMGAGFVGRRFSRRPNAERVVLTNGTQSALNLLFARLVAPGGTLAVETCTYAAMKPMAVRLGIDLLGLAMDEAGILPDSFEAACRRRAPKALYTMPTCQNPTTVTMPLERRREIVAIAERHGVAIVEDDVYSLLPDNPPPAMSSLAPDICWHVLGLAKSVAAGLKVAYVVVPGAESARRMFWPGSQSTFWMAAPISAAVTSRLIASGGIDDVIAAVRNEVSARQHLLHEVLQGIPFGTSQGCLHVWIPLPGGTDGAAFSLTAQREGLTLGDGEKFHVGPDAPPAAIRIGLGSEERRDDLAAGLDRFRALWRSRS